MTILKKVLWLTLIKYLKKRVTSVHVVFLSLLVEFSAESCQIKLKNNNNFDEQSNLYFTVSRHHIVWTIIG